MKKGTIVTLRDRRAAALSQNCETLRAAGALVKKPQALAARTWQGKTSGRKSQITKDDFFATIVLTTGGDL